MIASPIHTNINPFRIAIDGENTKKLMEVYNYEWTEEEL